MEDKRNQKKEIEAMSIKSVRNRNDIPYGMKRQIIEQDKIKNQQSKKPLSEKKRRQKTRRKTKMVKRLIPVLGVSAVATMLGIAIPKITSGVINEPKGQEAEVPEQEEQDNDFKKGVKVNVTETETQKRNREISEDIKGLENQDEVTRYLKDLYINEYERITGDEKLNTSQIEIVKKTDLYLFELDNGQLVSTGEHPEATEKMLKNDSKTYSTTKDNINVYKVRYKNGKELIDEITRDSKVGGVKKVIPENRYEELKENDETSPLYNISDIVEKSFEIINQMEGLDKEPKNGTIKANIKQEKEDLTRLVQEYYSKVEQEKNQNQNEQNYEGQEKGE